MPQLKDLEDWIEETIPSNLVSQNCREAARFAHWLMLLLLHTSTPLV